MPSDALILPQAVLFDMDGTLTTNTIDFDLIRADMGIPVGPILEALDRMHGEEREIAEAKLIKWEQKYAGESELNDGCLELLDWLTARGVRSAVITRNTRSSLQTVFEKHGLSFEVRITREDGKPKPHPQPLLIACDQLGLPPAGAWMVGDWTHDVEAANAAGVKSVWLSHGRSPRPFPAEPWRTVKDLVELKSLLESAESKE